MAKTSTEQLLLDIANLINGVLGGPTTDTDPVSSSDDTAATGTDYASWSMKKLREELIERGYEEDDVKAAPKDELVQTLEADDGGESEDEPEEPDDDEDEADDEEAEDEDDEESEGYTEDDLKELSKDELLEIVEENEIEPSGTTKAKLIAAILEWQDSGDEEEDEDDEDGEDVLDEDALNAMSLAEVKAVAKEYGVKVAKGASQDDIVAAILESQEEDDEEEEESEDGEYDRESLMAMSLKDLKAFAKSDGWTAAELKGADKDTIVNYYFPEDD